MVSQSLDVSNYRAPTVLSQIQLTGAATDVGVDTNLELAAVAEGSGGLDIVDVSNPMSPIVVQTVGIDATVVQVFEGIAYANDGTSLDAIDLASGDILQRLNLNGAALTGLALDGTKLYAMDASDRLTIFDVSSSLMVEEGSVVLPDGGGSLFVANGVAYVPTNDVFSGGYLTVNVSNPASPTLIQTPQNNGIESGAIALNGSGLGVAIGQDGGGSAGVLGVDVINTSTVTNTGQFLTRYTLPPQLTLGETEPFGIAIGEGIAFVAAGTDGLQVVNYATIDTSGVGPTITVVQEPGGNAPGTASISMTEGATATFQISISDPGQVRNVALLLNGQTVANDVSYPFDLSTVLPSIAVNGSNQVTLAVQASDTAGNIATTDPITVTLLPDTTPPTLLSESVANGSIHSQALRAFTFVFSKPIDPSTVTDTSFMLTGPDGADAPHLDPGAGQRTDRATDLCAASGGDIPARDQCLRGDRPGRQCARHQYPYHEFHDRGVHHGMDQLGKWQLEHSGQLGHRRSTWFNGCSAGGCALRRDHHAQQW